MAIIQGSAKSSARGFYPLTIDQSLRFNDDDSAYLSRTPASAGNRKTWTWSGWVKRGNIGSIQYIASAYYATSIGRYNLIRFTADDTLNVWTNIYNVSTSTTQQNTTTAVFRDPSSWYHIVISFDSTNATASSRLKIYVNGISQQYSGDAITLNQDTFWNGTDSTHKIGDFNSSSYLDGYLAEVHFTDGTAYDADAFGEFKSGVWVAKSPSVTYGTNGFYLDFANSADIGNDVSGEGNDWTPNNFTASDVVLDSPTDNFAVWNALDIPSSTTLSDGNLVFTNNASSTWKTVVANMAVSSGKWYAEFTGSGFGLMMAGIIRSDWNADVSDSRFWTDSEGYGYYNDSGQKFNSGSGVSYGATYTNNDVIGVALDLDAGTLTFYKNNVSQGTAFTGLSGEFKFACGVYDTNTKVTANFGQLGFTYTPPTGYLALSTANLPDPVIDPAQDESPSDYFNTVLYTGDNTSSRAITGVGFQPDFTWIKERNTTQSHTLFDAVRGAGERLKSDSTDAEASFPTEFQSFDSDGFTVEGSTTNNSGTTYVAWNWKANGSGVSNTDGSITSTVSANTTSGFSIVSYTGTGANATVGHGLDSAPDLIIAKNRDTTNNWTTFHNLDTDIALFLNSTSASASGASFTAYWTNTAPTTSVFSVGTNANTNGSGNDMIAYVFSSVEGFSKFGSYTGNGSADGSFVFCGFRPAFVMVKRTDAIENWHLLDDKRDPYNYLDNELYANLSNAEGVIGSDRIDFLSNGFKCRTSNNGYNASGGTYIFMAFSDANGPFKYSNAR